MARAGGGTSTQELLPGGLDRGHHRTLCLTLGPGVLQVASECSSHSASCSPEWSSALEFGPNPGGK